MEAIARDDTGAIIASYKFDPATLELDVAVTVGSDGDPVRAFADSVVDGVEQAGARLSSGERQKVESIVSKGMMSGAWPKEIEVRGKVASRVSKSEVPVLPNGLFEQVITYPSEDARWRYENLVGLDEYKARLLKEAVLLTQSTTVTDWSARHHGSQIRALDAIRHGTPLVIFAGDVGTGKTALAESFGDAVVRSIGGGGALLRMSIRARGSGIVGDMSKQITGAFAATADFAKRSGTFTVLLLDEADAFAESRETAQMHHEDRAGVNALIQGVDGLRSAGVAALVIFCSNRTNNIDPAIRRRAVDIFEFSRPDDVQRRAHLQLLLGDLSFTDAQWDELVALTGPRDGKRYGFTYSDISDRLVRNAVLAAFPAAPLSFEVVKDVATATVATRPFAT